MSVSLLKHNYLYSALLLLTIFLAGPAIHTANAEDGQAQKCFGPPTYNCYSLGDVLPSAADSNYETLYQAYASFAWQDFLALNFPAEANGEGYDPEPSSVLGLNYNGGNYTTVWQTYIEARDMFPDDGSAPPAFGSGAEVPDVCLAIARQQGRSDVTMMVSRISKAATVSGADVLDEYIQANRMGPLVDQNGKYARFGINFNKPMYDYIVDNQLYNAEGQIAFDSDDPNRNEAPVQWPRGAYDNLVYEDKIGAIMVKAAWKVLGANDDKAKFHWIDGYVYNAAGGAFGQEPVVQESCEIESLGLVGLHIVHRTNSSPQWIWSTFEHIDNAPWYYDFRSGTPSGDYSFFNPDNCPATEQGVPADSCDFNQVPDHPWDPERTDLTPTNVIRMAVPGQYAISMNYEYRRLLQESWGVGGTVWENYFLVDVQFPTITKPGDNDVREVNEAYPDGLPTPTFLPNSMIETYVQGFVAGDATSNGNEIPTNDTMQVDFPAGRGALVPVDPWNINNGVFGRSGGAQRNTSSCLGCHGDAALVNGTFANYVFSMSRAQSTSQNDDSDALRSWIKNLHDK